MIYVVRRKFQDYINKDIYISFIDDTNRDGASELNAK